MVVRSHALKGSGLELVHTVSLLETMGKQRKDNNRQDQQAGSAWSCPFFLSRHSFLRSFQ